MKSSFCLLVAVVVTVASTLVGCDSTSDSAMTVPKAETTAVVAAEETSFVNGKWADDDKVPTTLAMGDQAPAVHVSEWMLGDAIEGFDKDKVHVVEFWATWCGPCLRGMPHLSELAEEYRGKAEFIGVTSEDSATVAGFLKQPSQVDPSKTWQEIIKYNLVRDDDENRTNAGYMQAAKRNGIPCAFIVSREGIVEWIGHPMNMDDALHEIVEGTYDRDAALAKISQEEENEKKAMAAMQSYQESLAKEDHASALKALEEFGELTEQDVSPMKVGLLGHLGRIDEAKEILNDVLKENGENPQALNGVAWMIVSELPGELRDLDMALECAEKANKLTEESNYAVLDTLARVRYEMGDLESAIKWQTKAVEVEPPRSAARSGIKATLQKYLSEQKSAEKAEAKEDASEEKDSVDEKVSKQSEPKAASDEPKAKDADAPKSDGDDAVEE